MTEYVICQNVLNDMTTFKAISEVANFALISVKF